jgi:hypothetical protein
VFQQPARPALKTIKETIMAVDKATKILGDVDNRVIMCRGDRHPWAPLWKPGRVPRGTRYAKTEVQGVYFVHQDCPNCSRWREKLMAEGERWAYGGGIDGFTSEPGSERAELGRVYYTAELIRRATEDIKARGLGE